MAEGRRTLFGVPRRYAFIAVDVFLLCAIVFYAVMPSGTPVGPMAGYATTDGRWVTETTVAADKAGPDPKPWLSPNAARRKKRHPKRLVDEADEDGGGRNCFSPVPPASSCPFFSAPLDVSVKLHPAWESSAKT